MGRIWGEVVEVSFYFCFVLSSLSVFELGLVACFHEMVFDSYFICSVSREVWNSKDLTTKINHAGDLLI
jgi:F420-dependent methylenetetrahydromethanopterin dehydrogenase